MNLIPSNCRIADELAELIKGVYGGYLQLDRRQ